MSIKNFIHEVEKGLGSSVYFLYAGDRYLLKEAASMAAKTIPEVERDFSFEVFDLDGIDEAPPFEKIADILNMMPFMGKRRLVVIENIQELSKKETERLEFYVSNPSPHAVLILLYEGSPKAQFRESMKRTKAISLDIRPQDLPLWIREKAGAKGLTMTNGAIDYLVGLIGPDMGLISSEIEKFAYIGKSHLDIKDIAAVIRGNSDYDVFDLVNALRDRDAGSAFKIARALQETQESYGLLGAINWHYSRMSLRDKGRGAYYDRVFELLNEADIRIKTSGGTFPLEYLLIRLLRI